VKDEYDPIRKTGLLPRNGVRPNKQLQFDNNAGGQAYIVGGKMISGQKTTFADEFVHEKLGREKGRSLKRRKDEKREEEALKSFLEKEMKSGSTGAKYLRAIQELQSSKDKGQEKPTTAPTEDRAEEGASSTTPFRAETVRKIGFNPAAYSDPLQGFKVSAETNKNVSVILRRIRCQLNLCSLPTSLMN
jgi:minichromosome maintenance protein 10